ncbi:hypothetical protein ACUAWQ_004769 [Escherichia coli]|uniref:hypothetical protein n=1 Tax=Enterobacteriaceae TaxID=543 RepID=UPI00178FEBC0|nr:hypothetical protein [Escherichia coli]
MKNRKAKILLVRRNDPRVLQWTRISNRRTGLFTHVGQIMHSFRDGGFWLNHDRVEN